MISCSVLSGLIVSSVGLKVTSLKWIGQEPKGSEAFPRVQEKIEYNDTVERVKEISIADAFDLVDQNGMCNIHDYIYPTHSKIRERARSNARYHRETKATDDDTS